jgi:hypothetical protein
VHKDASQIQLYLEANIHLNNIYIYIYICLKMFRKFKKTLKKCRIKFYNLKSYLIL